MPACSIIHEFLIRVSILLLLLLPLLLFLPAAARIFIVFVSVHVFVFVVDVRRGGSLPGRNYDYDGDEANNSVALIINELGPAAAAATTTS